MSPDGRRDLALALYRIGGIKEEHFANCVLEDRVNELGAEHAEYLDTLAGLLSEWGTTDEFCIVLLQPYLRNHPEQALELVRRWNSSRHIWKRRASVVTFTRKVGESGMYTSVVLELCEPLLFDPEDLVRKGVGWALKDNLRGDRATVLAYVKELRRRGVSSVITLYAIRDLRGEERDAVLAIRPSR